MRKKDYETTVKMNHNESLFITNKETGETKEVIKRQNNFAEGKELWIPDSTFRKFYPESWDYLKEELSDLEFKATFFLAMRAKAYTNSLEPLNDNTTYTKLTEVLGVGKNSVDAILKKLWKIGVYGKFEVVNSSVDYTKYWVLNPYLFFSGKFIKSDIANLFSGTRIAIEYRYRIASKQLK